MDKEEILARSRRERVDEGAKNAENHGMKIGIVCFLANTRSSVLMAFNFFTGQQNDALLAVFWAYVAAEAFPRAIGSAGKNPCWSPPLRAGCLPSPILLPM